MPDPETNLTKISSVDFFTGASGFVSITHKGIVVRGTLTYEEWRRALFGILWLKNMFHIASADLIGHGRRAYGEVLVEETLQQMEFPLNDAKRAEAIAKVPWGARDAALTGEHYYVAGAASLTDAKCREWLARPVRKVSRRSNSSAASRQARCSMPRRRRPAWAAARASSPSRVSACFTSRLRASAARLMASPGLEGDWFGPDALFHGQLEPVNSAAQVNALGLSVLYVTNLDVAIGCSNRILGMEGIRGGYGNREGAKTAGSLIDTGFSGHLFQSEKGGGAYRARTGNLRRDRAAL